MKPPFSIPKTQYTSDQILLLPIMSKLTAQTIQLVNERTCLPEQGNHHDGEKPNQSVEQAIADEESIDAVIIHDGIRGGASGGGGNGRRGFHRRRRRHRRLRLRITPRKNERRGWRRNVVVDLDGLRGGGRLSLGIDGTLLPRYVRSPLPRPRPLRLRWGGR